MERTCKKCGETKPIEEFYKSKTCKSGYGFICKKCKNKRNHIGKKTYKEGTIRICIECSKEKPIYSFPYKHSYRRHVCNSCMSKRRRDKYKYKYKYDPIKAKINRDIFKEKNPKSVKKSDIQRRVKNAKEINDSYVKLMLCANYGIHANIANQHPELIENYRQQILFKRLLKQKKDDKKTS